MLKLALGLVLAGAVFFQSTPASATTFQFIRHAESTANAGTATTPEEFIDPPLTELGQQQALELAQRERDVDLSTIYVSSYQRTSLTIAPTASEFGLTPIVVPAIREWSIGDDPGSFDQGQFADLFQSWLAGNTAAKLNGRPSSESLDELDARVVPAYNEIVNRHENEDDVVAIVGHGGSIGWTMPAFAQNVSLPFALSHGLRNTAIVDVALNDQGQPLVTNWDGIPFDAAGPAAVPEPRSWAMFGLGGMLLVGGLAFRRRPYRHRDGHGRG